jgi:hypothetical protein
VLDEIEATAITPLLTSSGRATGNPYRLHANEAKSFQGSNVLGLGFTMSPEEAKELIAKDPRNGDVLFPLLDGEDLNSSPEQSASRWVINFCEWPLERSEEYPECLRIVREKVKPERDRNRYSSHARQRWWQFERVRSELYSSIADLDSVLVRARVAERHAVVLVRSRQVLHEKLVVFASDSYALFALLQSSIHEWWAREYKTTLRTDMMYTPSKCFETFPCPCDLLRLEKHGERYHSLRADVMLGRTVGLTELYNLFQQPKCRDSEIQRLRDLHIEIDFAVSKAYGWTFDLGHGFHETKQGVRFTISPQARAKVLDLLLVLNHERYAAEQRELSGAVRTLFQPEIG